MTHDDTPGTFTYIGAWILSGVIARFSVQFLDGILASALIKSRSDIAQAIFISMPIEHLLIAGIFIMVYSMFSSLDMEKVMPWLWGLGGIGSISNIVIIATTTGRYHSLPILIYPYIFANFVGMVLIVRRHFRSNGRLEY